MLSPLSANRAIFIYLVFLLSPLFLYSQNYLDDENTVANDSIFMNRTMTSNLIDSNFINSLPLRTTNDFLKYLPGVIEHQGKFHINGGRYDETNYILDGLSILNHFSGEQLIDIPKFALKSIGLDNSNAINYQLRTGSNEFKYSVEHSTDNIGINSTNDFYEGQNRLGSYWYGYNETNFNAEGPIIQNQLTFFANANYKFMRDRNPQLYPGINGLQLFGLDDGSSDYGRNFRIDMPEGIVYGNSLQSYNILGKLSFRQDDFTLDFTGIFDHNLKDAPRNHVLDYFNRRLGKIEDKTGFFSLSAKHQISKTFWYNIDASYSFKNSETYDEHLKENFWAYGDSVANADAGIFWERSAEEIERWRQNGLTPEVTRYIHPNDYYLNGFSFRGENAIPVNYSKSSYESINVNSIFNYQLYKNNVVTFGFNIKSLKIRSWELDQNQDYFAKRLDQLLKYNPTLSIDDSKRTILKDFGVNNIGYDEVGGKSNSGLSAAPQPLITTTFIGNKYEENNLLINFGVEYFRFDLDNYLLIDAEQAQKSIEINEFGINPKLEGFKKSDIYSTLNPNFYIQYSFSDKNNLSFLYQRYSSIPNLMGIYNSFSYFLDYAWSPPSFYFTENYFNNDLKPTNTSQYEISYQVKLPILNYGVTGYYKSISNQPAPKKITSSDASSNYYNFWSVSNTSYSKIYGLNLSANLKRIKGFTLIGKISLQTTEGSKSEFIYNYETDGNQFIRTSIVPLDHQHSFSSTLSVDYLFLENNTRFKLLDLFENLNFTMTGQYISGHPHSIGTGLRNIDISYPYRKIEFRDLNAYLTPSNFQINFKLNKQIKITKTVELNLYIYALNLLNNENIMDVFLRTGTTNVDEYDRDLFDAYLEEDEFYAYGYRAVHNLVNVSYNPKNNQQTMFGEPRQIIMGIKLNL